MDDLVVIIMTIVIVGIGALGQLKKKKQAIANSLQPDQTEDVWDLVDEGTEFPVQKEPDFVKVKKPQPVIKNKDSLYNIKEEERRKAKLRDELAGKSLKIKAKQKALKDFSLRKAVIYSEILNRKYT
jgi:hypothetical protein